MQNFLVRPKEPSQTRKQTVHMKCDVLPNSHYPSPGRCVTQEDGAHRMCRLPKPSHHTRILSYLQSGKNVPRSLVPRAKPRTQCHTSATSLRKQNSKLRVSDPKHGVAHMDVCYRHSAMDGAYGGNPAPHRQELTRLVCSAS